MTTLLCSGTDNELELCVTGWCVCVFQRESKRDRERDRGRARETEGEMERERDARAHTLQSKLSRRTRTIYYLENNQRQHGVIQPDPKRDPGTTLNLIHFH